MTERLRIAYILKRYPRLSETFIVNEMRELARQGVDVTIVAIKDSGETIVHDHARSLKAPIYYLPPKTSFLWEAMFVRFLETLSSDPELAGSETLKGKLSKEDYVTLLQASVFAPFLKSLGVHHLHAHFATSATTAAYFFSLLSGIPYSFTAHAKDIFHNSVDRKILAEKIEKASFVVTVSEFNRRYLQALLNSESRQGQIMRLYNGIDLGLFKPAQAKKEPGLIVAVGRLVQKKGFAHLIEACRILKQRAKNFRCAIIGEGPEKAALEAQIARYALEPQVSLLGAKAQSEVMALVGGAHVFVLPCVIADDGNRDGLPTALLEAMALGVPVLSTRITGIPEIIENGVSGLLVEEKNPQALAEGLELLLERAELCNRLSKAALRKVRKDFDVAVNVKSLKNKFAGVCRFENPVPLS